MMRQVFNDTDAEVLWLILGAPENELEPGKTFDIKRYWPVDSKQLPKELEGTIWPPKTDAWITLQKNVENELLQALPINVTE
jgi:hypothetical protein